jgi:DNA-directed RNA polymerase subunit RPC12/RpoP
MIEQEFNAQSKDFMTKHNLSELAISIDLISLFYNNKIKNNLVSATKHYTDILYDTENYSSRIDLFDNLYEIGVLKGGKLKGYYECVRCSPNTFNGVITSDLKPSKLKMKCPGCGKEILYIVPYELDENIYNHIIDNDGILFFAIQYLFEKHQVKHLSNHKILGDIEFDFCLLNEDNLIQEIIEVKMFKTGRPTDTQIGNIRSSVGQIKKSIDKIVKIESGYQYVTKSLVTNINDDNINKLAIQELKSDLDKYNINIYTIDDFKARMETST